MSKKRKSSVLLLLLPALPGGGASAVRLPAPVRHDPHHIYCHCAQGGTRGAAWLSCHGNAGRPRPEAPLLRCLLSRSSPTPRTSSPSLSSPISILSPFLHLYLYLHVWASHIYMQCTRRVFTQHRYPINSPKVKLTCRLLDSFK